MKSGFFLKHRSDSRSLPVDLAGVVCVFFFLSDSNLLFEPADFMQHSQQSHVD